ncbi:MAG: hypothetical protein WA939_10870 [Nodosilinea sp.]
MTIGFHLLVENAVFFVIATGFLAIAGWAWRRLTPFELPKPLPGWFKYWFGSVQVLGIVPPLVALVWAIWQGEPLIWMVFTAYFVLLGLQILSELLTLKQLHSVVWVMVPYLYVPYRLWQLYEGLDLTTGRPDLVWIQMLLVAEIVVWGINYLLDLAQLPRLFRWQ